MRREDEVRKSDRGAEERRLIRAAQDGSEEALERLFRSHWPRAHRAAYLVVHDVAAAEDIAQESFLPRSGPWIDSMGAAPSRPGYIASSSTERSIGAVRGC